MPNGTTQKGVPQGDAPADVQNQNQPQGETQQQEPQLPPVGVVPGRQGLEEIFARRRIKAAAESGQEPPKDAVAILEEAGEDIDSLIDRDEPGTPDPGEGEPEGQEGADGGEGQPEGGEGDGQPEGDPAAQQQQQQQGQPAQPQQGQQPPAGDQQQQGAGGEDDLLKPPPGHRAVKVNGQIRFVAEAEVDKLLGLALSSTERFQEAARLRDEALRAQVENAGGRTAQPQQGQQQDSGAQPTAPKAETSPSGDPELDPELDPDAFVNALMFGTDAEEAKKQVEALFKAIQKGRGTDATTPERIAAAAAQQVVDQMQSMAAYETFSREYPDIVGDEEILKLGVDRFNEVRVRHLAALGYNEAELRPLLRSEEGLVKLTEFFRSEQRKGRAHPDIQIFRAIGESLRKKFNLAPRQPANPAPSQQQQQQQNPPARGQRSLAERRSDKRAAPQPPAPATRRFALPTQQAPQPKSRSDIIQEMRRRRGLPT